MNRSIVHIHAREILDSRGNPTLETQVRLEDGSLGVAAVPSGASTGAHEAVELRDGDRARYGGKGVLHAQAHVNNEIFELLRGFDARQQGPLDQAMRELDGTENKSRLGANAILSVSLAAARAAAVSEGQPLWRYLGGQNASTLPVPLMNVLNGGAHAGNMLDIQEFMLVPVGVDTFRDALRMGAEIYHALGSLVGHCGVGDEGGYAPSLASHEEALDLLCRAIEAAGYRPGADVYLALDAAVSAWYDAGSDRYRLPKSGKTLTREELLTYWQELARRYPLLSLEDGMGEDDESGWQALSGSLGERVQLVGDDLFVTNPARIARGVEQRLANAVLIKPNQIGTLTETVEAVRATQAAGWAAVLSHRSGETEDSTSPTSRSRSAARRSRPVLPAAASARQSTTVCSPLNRRSAGTPAMRAARPSRYCLKISREIWFRKGSDGAQYRQSLFYFAVPATRAERTRL